ncbi:hypothetical protein FKM82_029939 [Ascaphus truei]
MLLRHCHSMKVPATKLGNLKSLRRDLAEEQHRMEANEVTLQALQDDIEKAVQTAHRIEEDIVPLEEKVETLKREADERRDQQLEVNHANSGTLQLPKATFRAPTMHEDVRMLKNPDLLLKELRVIEETSAAMDLRRLIEKSYAETDALRPQ